MGNLRTKRGVSKTGRGVRRGFIFFFFFSRFVSIFSFFPLSNFFFIFVYLSLSLVRIFSLHSALAVFVDRVLFSSVLRDAVEEDERGGGVSECTVSFLGGRPAHVREVWGYVNVRFECVVRSRFRLLISFLPPLS